MWSARASSCALLLVPLLLAACGGSSDADDATVDVTSAPKGTSEPTDDPATEDPATEDPATDDPATDNPATDDPATDNGGSAPVDDVCALLDAKFLNDAFDGVPSTFGGALDFGEPAQSWPAGYCQWPEAGGGQGLQVRVDDAASVDTDNHTSRAYNLDEEPIVEPQDGPGTKAVLLKDNAFGDVGGEPLTYGYFFVEGDAAVFVETTGFDAGPEALRTVADEVDSRLAAG